MNNKTLPNYLKATKNQRALHFVVDWLFLNLLVLLIAMFMGLFFLEEKNSILNFLDNIDSSLKIVLFAIFRFIYFSICEILWSKSFAKLFTKTQVVDFYGNKPNLQQTLTRSLVRIVPLEALTYLGKNNSGWHDTLSDTIVVDSRKFEEYMLDSKLLF